MASEEPKRAAGVESFATETKKEGENIVREVFPAKVVEMEELLRGADFSVAIPGPDAETKAAFDAIAALPKAAAAASDSEDSDHSSSDETRPAKRARKENGEKAADGKGGKLGVNVPSNKQLQRMINQVRREVKEATRLFGIGKMWIQLCIPKIEDGNNFGVSVQEEIVGEFSRAEDTAYNALESVSKYLSTRAKLVARFAKHRSIEDFRLAVDELDDLQHLHLRLCIRDLRNAYANLHDTSMKNMDRLKKPRGSGSGRSGMY